MEKSYSGALRLLSLFGRICAMVNRAAFNRLRQSGITPKFAFVAMSILVQVFACELAQAAWLDPAWKDRIVVTVSNPGGTFLNNFQVHVTLYDSFKFVSANTDGSDVRFTTGDGSTPVPFWIEKWDRTVKTASLWVRVPEIPASGATLYMYFGNPSAVSASSGDATFEFFDDFEKASPPTQDGYFSLQPLKTALVQDQPWEETAPHTLSVVPVNDGGYTYWGYYGLQNGCGGVGLAFSNDLVDWTKYLGNPIIFNARWPSVLKVGGTFYMLYTKDYCYTSYINLATSTDGIRFSDVKTIVQPQKGLRNQNPNLFLNPNDGKYYIYWFNGGGTPAYVIRSRSATSIEGLDDTSSETIVLQSNYVLAAPNMLFYNGTYFLSTESMDSEGLWEVLVFASTSPTSGFSLVPGNPVLGTGSACMFQYVVSKYLHEFYCKLRTVWTVEHLVTDLTMGRQKFGSPDAGKWVASGNSTWVVATDTQQDGSMGGVAQGSIASGNQALFPSYQGSDYVLEAYGKQQSGRVWGLGVRVTDQNNLYSVNLYSDLDWTNNVYVYDWLNGSDATLKNAAVGTVTANKWYKLLVKAHSNLIDVYKDDALVLQTSSSQQGSGGVALYGEHNTIAEFDNVLVRKYEAIEPSATILTLSSVTLNPTSVAAGKTSLGTVVLSGPALSGGISVSLSSDQPAVAGVPASVTVPAGATSATFTMTTGVVSKPTSVTVSAVYNETAKTAVLKVRR